jgi:hypothetical protein
MKKMIFAFVLLAALVVTPVVAQDFTSAKPQFFSLSFGIPIGYDLETEETVAGQNFTLTFAVLDNFTVGFDRFALASEVGEVTANFLRMAYSFTDDFGAAFGYGTMSDGAPLPTTSSAISIGAFANLFQNRTSLGLTNAISLRLDYLAQTENFGDGAVLFTLGATLGL